MHNDAPDTVPGRASSTPAAGFPALLLFLPVFLAILLIPVQGRAGEKLRIFYSNDVHGELEACG